MEKVKVIVFGNSVFAEHIYALLTHDSPYEVAAFTVDRKYLREDTACPSSPSRPLNPLFLPRSTG